jgi:hypothetical protein
VHGSKDALFLAERPFRIAWVSSAVLTPRRALGAVVFLPLRFRS